MKCPTWTDPDAHCDRCEQRIADTPAGLMSVDREVGAFGGDYTACSNCVITAHFTGHLVSVEFAYINWFWWPGVQS